MADKVRRLGRDASNISERNGGLGVPNLVIREENGKIAFDNRDVTAMAKFSVARGGKAADDMSSPRVKEKYCQYMVEKYWMEELACPNCKAKVSHFKWVLNKPKDQDGRPPLRCWSCWGGFESVELKEEEKENFNTTNPYIERYVNVKNNKWVENSIIIEYLEKHTDEIIPEEFKENNG